MIGDKAKITRGPWQVIREEHPHHLGGKHVEFRIFTVWSHPQLKGPFPVVNSSVGVGAEASGPARHMVWIDEADAYLIAAAPDLLKSVEDLLAYAEDVLSSREQLACFKPGVVQAHVKAAHDAIAKATTIPSHSQGTEPNTERK